jgi:hypothetical protein
MTWAAAAGAAVSVVGGMMGSSSAKKAAGKESKAAKYAAMIQQQQYEQNRKDMMPWMDRGKEAGSALQQRMGLGKDTGDGNYGELMRSFTNADFVKDPGYQFRMDEGQKGVERGAAARGGLLSGAAAKEMQRYGQGFASNEFGNAYGRYNQDQGNRFNRLQSISAQGQGVGQYLGNAGAQNAEGVGNALRGSAAAKAGGIMGAANAWSGALGGMGGAASGIMDQWKPTQTYSSPSAFNSPSVYNGGSSSMFAGGGNFKPSWMS